IVTDDAAEIAAGEISDSGYVETADEAGADEESTADAGSGDASLAGQPYDTGGIILDQNGNTKTKVSLVYDSKDKGLVKQVAAIAPTTDPVSWNNYYASNLIKTVIDGTDREDQWLTNKEKFFVSENTPGPASNILPSTYDERYASIKVDDGIYLFVEYGLHGSLIHNMYVKGYDKYYGSETAPLPAFSGGIEDLNKKKYNCLKKYGSGIEPDPDEYRAIFAYYAMAGRIGSIPSIEWDGRKVVWDKDGKYSATKTQKEALYVKTALVKYEGSTLTEIPGAEVTAVKIDPKTIKKASIENGGEITGIDVKYYDKQNNKEQSVKANIFECKSMGTLPTFKISVKVKGKDSKKYNKKIKEALAKESFVFGLFQRGIEVDDPTDGVYINEYYGDNSSMHYIEEFGKTEGTGADTLSGCEVKSVKVVTASTNDITKEGGIQDTLVDWYGKGGYKANLDKDSHELGKVYDQDNGRVLDNGIKIRKFNNDKAVITDIVNLYKDGVYTGKAEITLKAGKDYKLTKGKLAGEEVYVLDFDGDNYTYDKGVSFDYYPLAAFGYKYAFRKTPGEKTKTFRFGIFADSEVGFVYNAE
nr:hypothetical protein [Lachnospiraceae bacterium]